MKKILAVVLLLVTIGLIVFLNSSLNRIYLPTATGYSAKQACSLHLVSGFPLERARAMYIDPLLEPALPVLRVSLDTEQQSAHASLLGLYRQTAVYRPGLGCSLVHDPSTFDASLALPDPDGFQPLSEDVAHRAAHFDEDALEAALDQAFAEPTGGGRNTLAVA